QLEQQRHLAEYVTGAHLVEVLALPTVGGAIGLAATGHDHVGAIADVTLTNDRLARVEQLARQMQTAAQEAAHVGLEFEDALVAVLPPRCDGSLDDGLDAARHAQVLGSKIDRDD